MPTTIVISALVLTLSACSATPGPAPDRAAGPSGDRYLENGPTTALDVGEEGPQRSTALQLLEQKSARVRELEQDLEEARRALGEAVTARDAALEESSRQTERADRLDREVARLLASRKELNQKLLEALIKIRELEKSLLSRQLADMAKDDDG